MNNPTIEFPDYTLGVVYQRTAGASRPQVNAVLAASNGLADNPNLSYNQLVELTDASKGFFAGIGLGWERNEQLLRVGGWVNTSAHDELNGQGSDKANFGLYGVYGRSWGSHAMNVRAGAANERLSQAAGFVALAYRYRWGPHALGLGMGHAFLSSDVDDPLSDDTTQLEVFGRFAIADNAHVTTSVQLLRHSGFVADAMDPRNDVAVGGLRFHYNF